MTFQAHYLLAIVFHRWAISSDNGEGQSNVCLHLQYIINIHCVGTLVLERKRLL